MSRVGRKPVAIPEGVTVSLNGNTVEVKGSKGSLSYTHPESISVKVEGNEVIVTRPDDEKINRQLHGTVRALINNMVVGVHDGYKKELVIVGTGYKAAIEGKNIVLYVGYSNPIKLEIPSNIKAEVTGEKSTFVSVSGIDKQAVGQFSALIREVRPPEPYNGKGISYKGEHIRRKEGKKAGKK